ncbi:MAG TPA: GtrA family protein [Candidatus Hydrogenedentes bacterium]|nr:GtrA family protein [Candidatus Hydrogenedentota bacterium]
MIADDAGAESSCGNVPRQFGRYMLVGLFNTAFGYAVYAGLTYALTPRLPHAYMAAAVIGSVLSITVAFVGYKVFVFQTRGNWLREYLRVYMVYGTSMLTNLILLPFVVAAAAFFLTRKEYAPYIAGAALQGGTILMSFFGHRHFSFRATGKR